MAATCYFDSSVLTWDDSIAAWDEDKCYNDISLFSDAKLNVHLDTLIVSLASIDVNANSTYLLNNSNFLYNLLTPIEANSLIDLLAVRNRSFITGINASSLIDLLAVCNRSFITGINASSTFTAINRNTIYKEVRYNSTSDLLTVLKAVKTFVNTITSKAAVSTINSNFLYNLLTPIEASSTFTAINRNTIYKEVWYNSTSDLLTVLKAVKTFANTITSKAAVSTINSNFLYNLLTPIEANSLIDLLAVCNRSFITGINASSTFTAINRNTIYKEVRYNSTSDLLTVLKAVKTFVNTITSKAAVSTINSNFLYNLISEVYGSFEVFIYNSLKTNFIISINAISGKGYRSYLTLPETYSQFLVPLNKYRFKNDNLSSTLMNTEMTNIYNILNMVYNGFSNYGGVYKWEFNKTENSLDLIFKDKVIMRIDALSNLKVKGTITENYTF